MATTTYTQPEGTSASSGAGDKGGHWYFQDIELNPATVADGTLLDALDTWTHPKKGVKQDPKTG